MSLKRKFLSLTIWILAGLPILFFSFDLAVYGQTSISGVINTVSARIDSISAYDSNNVDSVYVNNATGFNISDTVLIHMTVGAGFFTSGAIVGLMAERNNAGKYAIFLVKGIDYSNNFIILNSTLPNFSRLLTGESGQIVKIPTYKSAIIANTLTCNTYDPATGTGGILAFFVEGNLIFNADINVDGKGFPGADPGTAEYTGSCSASDTLYKEYYFNSTQSKYSALKGYSIAYSTNDLVRGRGPIINGGGGGNGKYAGGGGGGSGGGSGGKGGFESESCGSTDIGGLGGLSTSLFYKNDGLASISLGGGGGTSSQNPALSRIATSGGNGGGIVVIVCDTLIGNLDSTNIYARGESVTDSSSAGSGGGGGGGSIILHVNKYKISLKTGPKFWVTGGKGGSVFSSAPEACGPGGGGGPGMIWYNGTSYGSVARDFSFGENGFYKGLPNGAFSGSVERFPLNNLLMPIRGFLFNYIPDADTICLNDAPKTINAAAPVGGKGLDFYSYNWLQSHNSITWENAAGTRSMQTYLPPDTTKVTMFYKRFATDGFVSETSNVVKMVVLPLLYNNNVNPADTTVCANLDAGTLWQPKLMAGGNGSSYLYTWEKSLNGTFSDFVKVGTSKTHLTPEFSNPTSNTEPVWYRRKVVSSACKSTSNSIKINVLPVITNNILSPNQEICTTRTPSRLTGGSPGGGAGAYSYRWQKKTGASWSNLVTTDDFQPPSLTLTQFYRRIVISGLANTCKDTSSVDTISVMPDITSNTLDAIKQNILCYGLKGDTLTASNPLGGNGFFDYYWQKNNVNASGGDIKTDFLPGILTLNTTFRRIVTSGTNPDSLQRCWSISNERAISILDKITNDSISVPKTVWCEGKTPDTITGSEPRDGNGTYSYSWQSKPATGEWGDMDSTNRHLITPVITSSIDYRRIVKSGLNETCKDTSLFISFMMQDSILNNRINNDVAVFVCFDEDSTLWATAPELLTGGDGADYAYLWLENLTADGTYNEASQPEKTNPLYRTEAIQTTRYYKRRVISGDCENTSVSVKIEPIPLPEITALKVDPNEICYSKLDSVITASIQSGSPPYIITFSDGQGFTDSRTIKSGTESIKPQISNPELSPGYIDYTYKVIALQDAKGCYAKAGNLDPFSATLKVFTTPMPSLIGDVLVESCSDTLQLSVNPSIGASSWHLSNIVGISSKNTTNPVINLTADYKRNDSASVSLAYVEDIANCHSDSIFVNAILYNNPDSIKNIYRVVENIPSIAGDPLVVFISDNQQFKADSVISGSPAWDITSGAGVLTDPTKFGIKITGLVQDDPTFLEYSISNHLCPVNKRTIKIERKELLVYDGFSPNNDGINDDLWAVGLADPDVDFKFQIFSSSGNFITEKVRKDIKEVDFGNNQVLLWDGTTNLGGKGNYIPEGTYYYTLIVKYHGENFSKRGSVVVRH
jgi:hypothetical protein